jgi:plasmid maintenance system killer protein
VLVQYSDPKFARQCADEKSRRRAFGAERAKVLALRLQHLTTVNTLADMSQLGGRTHELTGNWKNHFAVALDGPYRLIFAPESWPERESGGLDWDHVDSVVIIGIINYHD